MSAHTRRPTLVVGLALLLIVGGSAVAVAQQYPPGGATCAVGQGTVSPGDSVTVSGRNWLRNSTVRILLSGQGQLGTAGVNGQGSFSTVVTIPAGATTGSATVSCAGRNSAGNAIVLGTTISLIEAGGGIFGTAFTGADVRMWMFIALMLFGVGLWLLLVSRRRRAGLLR